jgi:3-methylcrotonyl-CoA carboxylase alpha subunit
MLDQDGRYYFLEMNTRLQVEHPVTELAYGVDLVHWQLRIANGETLTLKQEELQPRGWAIETRVYAEDPANHMLPSIGTITAWQPPEGPGIRVDAGVQRGSEVTLFYDPMLAKLIVWGEDRAAAIERLTLALQDFTIGGIRSNVPLLLWIARDEAYRRGETTTSFLGERLDESIFSKKPEISAGLLAAAAAALLRTGRAPWRLAGIGVPLRLRVGDADVVLEAAATADPNVWKLSGDYTGELNLAQHRAGDTIAQFSAPPTADASAHHAQTGGNGRIVSPMPGKIVKIAVRDGDAVNMHDLLLVLEAMKMEHRIEAPGNGTVGAIHVSEGEIVAGDTVLLELK